MALRYVGTIDDLTPERLQRLRSRVKRNRGVWDAKAERYEPAPESGMLVTQTSSSSYSMDPFGGISTLVNWRTGTAFVLGALAAALVAAIVWWWNRQDKGKKKGKKRRQIEASA